MTAPQDEKKMKIKLFETHFAWVNDSLLQTFTDKTGIKRRSQWIKDAVKEDFGIILASPSDIPKLDMVIRSKFYEDKGEWLRERMRKEIRKNR